MLRIRRRLYCLRKGHYFVRSGADPARVHCLRCRARRYAQT